MITSRRSKPQDTVAGFVLAGGSSRRMGRNKALLEIAGEPLYLRAANLLKPHTTPVILLGAPREDDPSSLSGFHVLLDHRRGSGPLAALLGGLNYSGREWNVILACDLPLMRSKFIEFLCRRAYSEKHCNAIVPFIRNRWQPLCAAYRKTCAPVIEATLQQGGAAMADLLPRLRIDSVTSEHLVNLKLSEDIFTNVNTPAEWQSVLTRVRTRSVQNRLFKSSK